MIYNNFFCSAMATPEGFYFSCLKIYGKFKGWYVFKALPEDNYKLLLCYSNAHWSAFILAHVEYGHAITHAIFLMSRVQTITSVPTLSKCMIFLIQIHQSEKYAF